MVGACRPLAARQEGFRADHPERRDGDDEARHAAGDDHLGEDQRAVADAQDQESAEAGGGQLTAARQVQAAGPGEKHRQAAGNDVAQAHQLERREHLQGHADAQVSGSPEDAHRRQGEVRLKQRMSRQFPA